MASELQGLRVAFVVANEGVEQAELTAPWQAIEDSGSRPELVATKPGQVRAMKHLDWADTFSVDRTTDGARAEEFDAVVLPGGVANADQLRTDRAAVEFLQEMFRLGKPAAVICHGAWALVEGGLVQGRRLTSWPSLRTDITNAGGEWVDQEVQVCRCHTNALVTSRKPDDLPAFCTEMIQVFQSDRQPAGARG
ncbi:MAG: type 1 glutamine amidotransferase domain-containing protein [Acidimicrobiales bacterium]